MKMEQAMNLLKGNEDVRVQLETKNRSLERKLQVQRETYDKLKEKHGQLEEKHGRLEERHGQLEEKYSQVEEKLKGQRFVLVHVCNNADSSALARCDGETFTPSANAAGTNNPE